MRSERVEFAGREGAVLAGRLERPAGEVRGVAVFAHCFTCSKDSAAASRISRALAMRGLATLRFDFTGLGGSDGEFASTNFSSNVADLVAAADFLRGSELGAPRLLVGHSLGGAAVLAAAGEIPEVEAVATIGAPSHPSHVEHLFEGALEEIRAAGEAEVCLAGRPFRVRAQFFEDLDDDRFREKLRALDELGVLILHSPEDEVVHIDHARRLYAQVEHPKSFVCLPGANHLLTDREDALYAADVLAAWASRYLRTRGAGDGGGGGGDGDGGASGEGSEGAAGGSRPPREGVVLVDGDGRGFAQDVVTQVGARTHALVADEPARVGGTEMGPTPYDLLLAGLGACTSMTLGMYARRKGWPLEHVSVELTHDRIHAADCEDCTTTEGKVDRITRVITMEGPLDGEQRARLLEIADRCPVHRTLEGEIRVRTREGGGG